MSVAPAARPLKAALDHLYDTCDYGARLAEDPLGIVRSLDAPRDQEVAGLLAASLAYGRVSLFLPRVRELVDRMGDEAGGPAAFVRTFDAQRPRPWLDGFRYRVTSAEDLRALLTGMGAALRAFPTLEDAFCDGLSPGDADIGPALSALVQRMRTAGGRPSRSLKHLLPAPADGSACKRLNLWLRWMVRRQEGVDLGIWTRVPSRLLILPLDTHSLRMAYNLGLTDREDMSWRNAVRITARLRELDAEDPVRYDFALCHLGMAGDCPARRLDAICDRCGLRGLCRWRRD